MESSGECRDLNYQKQIFKRFLFLFELNLALKYFLVGMIKPDKLIPVREHSVFAAFLL